MFQDKPTSDDPDALYIRIPDTNFSLRFWPGSFADSEYCMDFVLTATREPINVPDHYEVRVVPDPAQTWLHPTATKVLPIEQVLGVPKDEIAEGSEKYILRDGIHCHLAYKERPIMHFQVPSRPQAGPDVDDEVPTFVPEPAY